MQIFRNCGDLAGAISDFGLALGVFDGVHLGHQAVLDAARGLSQLGVLTFDPHPVQVLAPERAPRRILAGLEHKKLIFERLGVDFMVVIEFTPEFAAVEAGDFAKELLSAGVSRLAAGADWNFGRGRKGTMALLSSWAEQSRIKVVEVGAVTMDGARISSTRIRERLRVNDLEGAARLLGRPYSVYGEVVQGRQLGRTIGFPTANVLASDEQLPPNGVYLVEGNGIPGVANIGVRPTVDDSRRRALEVHLFSDALAMEYGWWLEVGFLRKIREERKFASVEVLREQITRDVAEAKRFAG